MYFPFWKFLEIAWRVFSRLFMVYYFSTSTKLLALNYEPNDTQ